MKILVLNSGSSSVKYQLFDEKETLELLVKGLVDRIGLPSSIVKHSVENRKPLEIKKPIPNHKVAITAIVELLTHDAHGVISEMSEIKGVGHRVVHGGEKFHQSVLITKEVIETIKECIELAPLHNPPNLQGIEACKELLPDVPQVAVFDTAFHQTMPKHAYLYGLPHSYYEKFGIRRYGFHGTSHKYVAHQAAKALGKDIKKLRIITCHLGNGCSITAVKGGKSIDTSMGFTPLEGVVMGTRSGDLDPYVPLYIMEKKKFTVDETSALLNNKSGLVGLSGKRDMRDILNEAKKNDEAAKLAVDVFCYRIAKYIGAYAMAMGGVDAIVFTAGIGENSAYIRKGVLANAEFLGLKIDEAKNEKNETIFSTPDSKVAALAIRTNEELVIAKDTYNLIKK